MQSKAIQQIQRNSKKSKAIQADPKEFSDPQLFDILKDEALLMGMDATEKKRKQYMRMKAVRLEKNPNIFNTGKYPFMKLPFMK